MRNCKGIVFRRLKPITKHTGGIQITFPLHQSFAALIIQLIMNCIKISEFQKFKCNTYAVYHTIQKYYFGEQTGHCLSYVLTACKLFKHLQHNVLLMCECNFNDIILPVLLSSLQLELANRGSSSGDYCNTKVYQ